MGMGAVLRRWRADGATAAAVAATVVTAMVMLAAGPIFADAVSVASLRQAVVAGSAGEVTVTVAGFSEAGGFAVVTVELGGIDDPKGLDSFRLQAPNTLVDPVPAESSCQGITADVTTCTIAFPAANLDGRDRQLVFRRGEEQVRWVLV